jgi:hypothetical protein
VALPFEPCFSLYSYLLYKGNLELQQKNGHPVKVMQPVPTV